MRLSPEETANFIANIEQLLQERWLSNSELVRRTGIDAAPLNKLLQGSVRPQFATVEKIALAFNRDPHQMLLARTHPTYLPNAATFIAEAQRTGLNIELTSKYTGIRIVRLQQVINCGRAKFTEAEIARLQRIPLHFFARGFSLPLLAPFTGKEVNMAELVAQNQLAIYRENKDPWFYKRQGLRRFISEKGLSIPQLSEHIGMPHHDFNERVLGLIKNNPSKYADLPTPKQWRNLLNSLSIFPKNEQDLLLMGQYNLSTRQLQELKSCQSLFTMTMKDPQLISTVAKMSTEDLFRLYVVTKHEWANHSPGVFSQSTLRKIIEKVSFRNFAIFAGVTLSTLIKSLPVAAAEALTEYSLHDSASRALISSNQHKHYQSLAYTALSHQLRFLLLLPKAVYAAFKAPFDAPRDVILSNCPADLPMYVLRRFIEADGYSAAIVNDWKTMWETSKKIIQGDHVNTFESAEFEEVLLNLYLKSHNAQVECQLNNEDPQEDEPTMNRNPKQKIPTKLLQEYQQKAEEIPPELAQLFEDDSSDDRVRLNKIAGDLHGLGMAGMNLASMAIEMGGHARTWRGVAKVSQGLMTLSAGMTSIAAAETAFSLGAITGGISAVVGTFFIGMGLIGDDQEEDNSLMQALSAIYQGLIDLENRLTNKLNEHLLINITYLSQINAKQDRLERIATISFKELHSKDLIEICDAIRKEMAREITLPDAKKIKYLQKLSTWIDLHSTSKIQTSMLRDSKDVSKCVEILASDDFEIMAMLPFFMAQLNRIASTKAKIDDLPNVSLLLVISDVYATCVHRYNPNGNHTPLLERTQNRLATIKKLIDELSKNEELIEVLFRQYNESRYFVGRAIEKCRADFSVKPGATLEQQLRPGLNNENLIQALDQLELRRLLLVRLAEMCQFQGEKLAHIVNLESKSDILNYRVDAMVANAEKMLALSRYDNQAIDFLGAPSVNNFLAKFKRALECGAAINAWDGPKNSGYPCGRSGAFGQAVHLMIRDRSVDPKSVTMTANMLHLLCKSENFEMNNPSHTAWGTWGFDVRPITWALNCGYFDLAVLLCANGYDISEAAPTPYCYPAMQYDFGNAYASANSGSTACIIQRDLVRAINTENNVINKKALRKAYEYYKSAEAGLEVSSQEISPYCVLLLVAILGDLRPLKLLSDRLTDRIINLKLTTSKLTALMIAVWCGKDAVVDYLLNHGANYLATGDFFPYEGPSQVLAMAKHHKYNYIAQRIEQQLSASPASEATRCESFQSWMPKNPNMSKSAKLIATESVANQMQKIVGKLKETQASLKIKVQIPDEIKEPVAKIEKLLTRAHDIYLLLSEFCKTLTSAELTHGVQNNLAEMKSALVKLKLSNADDDNPVDLVEQLEEFVAASNMVDAKLKTHASYKLSNNVQMLMNEVEKTIAKLQQPESVYAGPTSAMFKPKKEERASSSGSGLGMQLK